MQHKAVMHKGRLIHYAYEPAAANRAFELLGKELGMFADQVRQDTNLRVIACRAGDRGGLGGALRAGPGDRARWRC